MTTRTTILLLLAGMTAQAETSSWEEIIQCINEKDPGYFDRLERDYKPHVCPPVITNGLDSLIAALTNIEARVNTIAARTWMLNEPIQEQIDLMLRFAVYETMDETIKWVQSTNGIACMAETNEWTRWAESLKYKNDIEDKVLSDKRAMVSSLNWPVVTQYVDRVVTQECQRQHWPIPGSPVQLPLPPAPFPAWPTNWNCYTSINVQVHDGIYRGPIPQDWVMGTNGLMVPPNSPEAWSTNHIGYFVPSGAEVEKQGEQR